MSFARILLFPSWNLFVKQTTEFSVIWILLMVSPWFVSHVPLVPCISCKNSSWIGLSYCFIYSTLLLRNPLSVLEPPHLLLEWLIHLNELGSFICGATLSICCIHSSAKCLVAKMIVVLKGGTHKLELGLQRIQRWPKFPFTNTRLKYFCSNGWDGLTITLS